MGERQSKRGAFRALSASGTRRRRERRSAEQRIGEQQAFGFCDPSQPDEHKPRRGGRRDNAGRKAAPHRKGFEVHGVRPDLNERHPVHVVLRAKPGCPRLRQERVFNAIRRRIAKAQRKGFRIIHFSIQQNHIHLVCEAGDREMLWKGIQRLAQRITWDVNKLTHRRGSLWRDRYTRRDLTSLRQVRNALVYVLMNFRKHAIDEVDGALFSITLDPRSSAAWFDGWHPRAGPMLETLREELKDRNHLDSPVLPPRTWFARVGWKRHGLVFPTERPRSAN